MCGEVCGEKQSLTLQEWGQKLVRGRLYDKRYSKSCSSRFIFNTKFEI